MRDDAYIKTVHTKLWCPYVTTGCLRQEAHSGLACHVTFLFLEKVHLELSLFVMVVNTNSQTELHIQLMTSVAG